MLFFKKVKVNKKHSIILTIILIFVLVFSFRIYTTISRRITLQGIEKHHSEINQLINKKFDELLDYSINKSQDENIKKFIIEKDVLSILGELNEDIIENNIQTLLITDNMGQALTRVPASLKRGDNIFAINSFGRHLIKDEEIKVFDYGREIPLLMISGKLIKENNQNKGAIFSGQKLDTKYAEHIKKELLHKSCELIFYSNKEGLIASTFKDEKVMEKLSSYYNTEFYDSENETEEIRGLTVLGRHYLSKSIKLYDSENKYLGDIIIFHKYNLSLLNITLSLITTLILLFLFMCYFRCTKKIKLKKTHYLHLLLFSAFFFMLIFIINKFFFEKINFPEIEINNDVYTIYNSTISLNPDFDLIYDGRPHTISIQINSGGEAINAIEAVLRYDPKKIQIKNTTYSKSICDKNMFLEKRIDNANGVLSIACMIPSPGFFGSTGTLVDITFEASRDFLVGETVIEFDKNKTKILANDGLATNVLRKTNNGYYTIINNDKIDNYQDYLVIYSHTHPNQYNWYNNNQINLSWITKEEKYNKFIYKLDKNPFSSPTGGQITMNKSVDLKTYEDGTYYFHLGRISSKNEIDLVNHFKINVDISPPELLIVNYSDDMVRKGEIVRFEIDSSDKFSGIPYENNIYTSNQVLNKFYIKINNEPFFPVSSPVYIPFFKEGENSVIIRVFDEAENYKEEEVEIQVTK